MKKVYVVSFKKHGTDHSVTDCVFMNLEDAADYVNQWNEWERSEDGNGDLWYWIDVDFYETRVEL